MLHTSNKSARISSLIWHPIAAGVVLRASMSQHPGPQGYPAYGQPPYYSSNQQTQLPSAQQPFLPHPAHSAGLPAQQAYGQPGPGGFLPQRPQQARPCLPCASVACIILLAEPSLEQAPQAMHFRILTRKSNSSRRATPEACLSALVVSLNECRLLRYSVLWSCGAAVLWLNLKQVWSPFSSACSACYPPPPEEGRKEGDLHRIERRA